MYDSKLFAVRQRIVALLGAFFVGLAIPLAIAASPGTTVDTIDADAARALVAPAPGRVLGEPTETVPRALARTDVPAEFDPYPDAARPADPRAGIDTTLGVQPTSSAPGRPTTEAPRSAVANGGADGAPSSTAPAAAPAVTTTPPRARARATTTIAPTTAPPATTTSAPTTTTAAPARTTSHRRPPPGSPCTTPPGRCSCGARRPRPTSTSLPSRTTASAGPGRA